MRLIVNSNFYPWHYKSKKFIFEAKPRSKPGKTAEVGKRALELLGVTGKM